MTEHTIYQVDAFTDTLFSGNPAAVVPLKEWLPDETLKNIARENNLAETAFFVPKGNGFHLRWFTPTVEVNLCGHATLATAWVIFNQINYSDDVIHFESLSRELIVTKSGDYLTLNFPALSSEKTSTDFDLVEDALGSKPIELYKGPKWVAVYKEAEFIKRATPDFSKIKKLSDEGLVITAPGYGEYDFVSRYFAPQIGIDEDPVTGAAHCRLAPIWADKLGKTSFKARQLSQRGGDVLCELNGARVLLSGKAVLYMKGAIYTP